MRRPQPARVSRISSASIVCRPSIVHQSPLSLPLSTDPTSPLTSRGRTQTASIYHLEGVEDHLFMLKGIKLCLSNSLFPEDTLYQGPGLFSLIPKSSARLPPQSPANPHSTAGRLTKRHPSSMNKLNKFMQAPHKKHNLIPTGTTSSSSPKGSRPSIPLQISIQACYRDIMPPT
jgi:hypothetical protein